MMISPEQFWKHLESSGILPAGKIDSLKSKIAAKPTIADSTLQIARALVSNKILTEDQARVILSGQQASETEATASEMPQLQDLPQPASRLAANESKVKLPLLLGLAATISIAAICVFLFRPASNEVDVTDDASAQTVGTTVSNAADDAPYELTNSPDALWARPKPGEPIEIRYLPPGTQMLVRIRMGQLMAAPDGDKLIRSLGPTLERQFANWIAKVGLSPAELVELTLYLLPQGTTIPLVVMHGKLKRDTAERFSTLGQLDAQRLMKLATHAIWCPSESPKHFYYGSWDVVKDFPTTKPGRLRRELQQLHAESHDTDLVSILANPNFLRDEAQGLFPNTRQRLLNGLFAFWSDEAQAVSLGLQQDELAFLEVRMIARDDMQPRHLAAKVNAFLRNMPSQVRDFLGSAILDPHWQPLALRFPQMISFVVDHSRVVVDGKQVAMTSIAPKEATHNLLLASELGLATPVRESVVPVSDNANLSLDDVLATKTIVRFAQKSLDEATQDIAQQVREELSGLPFEFRIQIVGNDLEPEGITRNQQIRGFAAVDRTLAEILTMLMSKANPAQGVAAPSDPQQKLVWIKSPGEIGLIQITTRNAANIRNLELPEAFR